MGKFKKYGGWAVDGVEYSSARKASVAVGIPRSSFTRRCKSIGRRQVTSAELDQFRYAYPTRLGNDEWRALSDIGNTGLSRGMKR